MPETRRIGRAFAAICCVLTLLSACGRLPQPFAREEGAPGDAPPEIEEIPGVYVPVVRGTTEPMGRLLSEAVAEALNDKDVPAYVNPPRVLRFELTGQVEYEPDGAPKSISWQLTDAMHREIGTHDELISGPLWRWEYGDPKLLHEIGLGVARRFAAQTLPVHSTPDVAEDRDFAVRIAPVEGAPGDGNESLTRAMRTALRLQGVNLVENDPSSAVLEGKVDVGEARNGMQPVRIVWSLSDSEGKSIGEAAQANAVPAGSLDGVWGEIAGYAVSAAVDGILSLIDGARHKGASAASSNSGTTFPAEMESIVLPPPGSTARKGEE